MYIFNFAQRFTKPCMGHFFVVRNENAPNKDYNMTSEDLKAMKGTGYKLVFGGEYGKIIDVSELFRTLQDLNSDNGSYKFRSGDVLILVANESAYAYVMHSAASYYINKNTFAEECARDYGNIYLSWGDRNLLFSTCTYERAGMKIFDGYALEVYDDKDRLLLGDRCESIFQNWFVLLNQALMSLKEPVYDEFYHTFCYRMAEKRDKTTLVPKFPEVFFYVTDNAFMERNARRLEEDKQERMAADVHRKAMCERYGNRSITPEIIEDVALCHIIQELDYHADEPIAIKDVVFHSFSKEGYEALATVVVEYDSNMSESYVHDLLCVRSCSYTKGVESVYIEFVPVRKEQTGTFSDYCTVMKTGVSRKLLHNEGIETLYNGEKAYILLSDKDEKGLPDEGAYLPIYDADGNVLGKVKVYSWNCEVPYTTYPILFAEISGETPLSMEQRYKLIEVFDAWYGNTDQKISEWAVEFQLLTRMLIDSNTKGALLINPKFLAYEDELFQVIRDVIWPENEAGSAFGNTVPFWIGCVEHITGKILEVHSKDEATSCESLGRYFSEEIRNRHDKCEVSFFWIQEDKVILDPDTVFNSDDEGKFLLSCIRRQIAIVASDAAILLDETEDGIEKAMRVVVKELAGYDKHEYPKEWKEAAERWNVLVDLDPRLAAKIIKEYRIF